MAKKSTTFKGQPKPYGKSGHFNEPRRHSLQARGIKTGRLSWEKIGDVAKPKFQSMYGMKGKQDVVWLDNWQRGNWAIVRGKEIAPSTYKEEEVILNVGSKKEAKSFLKDYMKNPDADNDGVPDKYDCAPRDPTKQDIPPYSEVSSEVKKAVDEKFKEMVGVGDKYVVTTEAGGQSRGSYGLLGLCGFSHIHFKGAKNKNMLEKAGYHVWKGYPSGFDVDVSRYIAPDEQIRKLHPDARAYYGQSIDLKEVANRKFLELMQAKGYLKDAYVETRLD